jgi:hypothetical protein
MKNTTTYWNNTHRPINITIVAYIRWNAWIAPLKYIGQGGRIFNLRYREHIQAIRSNCSKSGYSNHILNTGHTYGTITDTIDVMRIGKKSWHLNTLERYHIYRMYKNNLRMNDVHIEAHNPVFQTVHELCNRQQNIHYLERYLSESNRTRVSIREESTKNIHNKVGIVHNSIIS